jgi:hypothetical protein
LKAEYFTLPSECDERLKEWARYFKDRQAFGFARSIEGRFQAHSPGSWDEGWGSQSDIPPPEPRSNVELPRVLRTHSAVMSLDRPYRWVVTYGFCYPYLERWQTLKFLRKYTGKRFSWAQYMDALDIARLRIWAALSNM